MRPASLADFETREGQRDEHDARCHDSACRASLRRRWGVAFLKDWSGDETGGAPVAFPLPALRCLQFLQNLQSSPVGCVPPWQNDWSDWRTGDNTVAEQWLAVSSRKVSAVRQSPPVRGHPPAQNNWRTGELTNFCCKNNGLSSPVLLLQSLQSGVIPRRKSTEATGVLEQIRRRAAAPRWDQRSSSPLYKRVASGCAPDTPSHAECRCAPSMTAARRD